MDNGCVLGEQCHTTIDTLRVDSAVQREERGKKSREREEKWVFGHCFVIVTGYNRTYCRTK